jgi:CRISPR-associated endonuclease/helicase Cas3
VATARRCFTLLQRRGIRCELLTGRVRPAERDARLEELLPLVRAGRARSLDAEPLVIVATQTIEVGADFDFDGLVTEAAPLSALRQRFGRVDRLGELGRAAGVVLLRSAPSDRTDAVYGSALAEAVSWLRDRASEADGVIDFGLSAMNELLARTPAPAEARVHAATLLPAHMQMLAQTGPFAPQIDLGAWLHGPSPRAPDVTLIWRDDLDAAQPAGWAAAVQLLPPMLREGLPMPAAAVRRWLTGARIGDEWSDAGSAADDARPDESAEGRAVLRWRGADDCEPVAARDIRPGDTLVLPSSYGGCDAWGWAPEVTDAVSDLADACAAERVEAGASRRAVLRLCAGHWPALGAAADGLRGLVTRLLELQQLSALVEEDLGDEIEAAAAALREAVVRSSHPLAPLLREAAIEPHPGGLVLRGEGVEELEGVVETGRAVSLDVHHADVARWAERLTPGDPRQAAIVDAARVHDAGKAEPRMQALLHGSAVRAAAGPLLAKSALRRRAEQTTAWRASGMPRGFRHEFASLERVVLTDLLVRHLVATHHGLGRPWLPPCTDPAAEGASHAALGSGWQAHWHAALMEHGPYELARMEWLLRAADARASMEEASDGHA